MDHMTSLTILDIGGNRFPQLPPYLFQVPNLGQLLAYDCHIQEISPAINQLKQLYKLILVKNPIKSFPTALAELPQLKTLEVSKQYFPGNKGQQLVDLLEGVSVRFY